MFKPVKGVQRTDIAFYYLVHILQEGFAHILWPMIFTYVCKQLMEKKSPQHVSPLSSYVFKDTANMYLVNHMHTKKDSADTKCNKSLPKRHTILVLQIELVQQKDNFTFHFSTSSFVAQMLGQFSVDEWKKHTKPWKEAWPEWAGKGRGGYVVRLSWSPFLQTNCGEELKMSLTTTSLLATCLCLFSLCVWETCDQPFN